MDGELTMGLFSKREAVPEDFMLTRGGLVYSSPRVRRYHVAALAAADDLVTATIPEAEGVVSVLLVESWEFCVLTTERLLHFTTKKVKKQVPVKQIEEIKVFTTPGGGIHRMFVKLPTDYLVVQQGTRDTEIDAMQMFAGNALAARDAALGR